MFCTYSIKNKVNNKCYYGSTNNFKKRCSDHTRLLTRNCHHSIKLQNAWNKHGQDNFVFSIIQTFDNADFMLNSEKALITDNYINSYNISTEVNKCHMLGRHHSKETKEKLSKMFKGRSVSQESIEKIKLARKNQVIKKGFKHSKETIEKIKFKRSFQKIKSGWNMTEEAKEKMRIARIGKKFPRYYITTPDGVYLGYEVVATEYNVTTQTIRNWIKKNKEGWSVENNAIRD